MSRGSVAVEPGSSAHVLVAEDLNKSYGSRKALLPFPLHAGRVLLGPNGAGKTTSTRILPIIPEPSTGYFAHGDAGWLRVELLEPAKKPPSRHLNNEIPNVLIRAEMPILAFQAKGGRLQDVFLQLTEETIQ